MVPLCAMGAVISRTTGRYEPSVPCQLSKNLIILAPCQCAVGWKNVENPWVNIFPLPPNDLFRAMWRGTKANLFWSFAFHEGCNVTVLNLEVSCSEMGTMCFKFMVCFIGIKHLQAFSWKEDLSFTGSHMSARSKLLLERELLPESSCLKASLSKIPYSLALALLTFITLDDTKTYCTT